MPIKVGGHRIETSGFRINRKDLYLVVVTGKKGERLQVTKLRRRANGLDLGFGGRGAWTQPLGDGRTSFCVIVGKIVSAKRVRQK